MSGFYCFVFQFKINFHFSNCDCWMAFKLWISSIFFLAKFKEWRSDAMSTHQNYWNAKRRNRNGMAMLKTKKKKIICRRLCLPIKLGSHITNKNFCVVFFSYIVLSFRMFVCARVCVLSVCVRASSCLFRFSAHSLYLSLCLFLFRSVCVLGNFCCCRCCCWKKRFIRINLAE